MTKILHAAGNLPIGLHGKGGYMLNTRQRIARLHELHDKITELAELEPRLIDDTDWHSNTDAITQMIDIIECESHKELEELANEALNVAVKHIQDKLNIKDGSKAGNFFSDRATIQDLYNYICYEMKE